MANWAWNLFTGDQKNASNLPPVTALEEQRSKQITSLRNLNPNVVELKVQTEYRITFTQQGQNIALNITLPPQFPQDKPTVRISPPCQHPWISPNMEVVGCPRLRTFGVHTDLGRVMQDIIQEFTQNPPVIYPSGRQPPISSSYPPYPNGLHSRMPVPQTAQLNTYQPIQNPSLFRPHWPPMAMSQGEAPGSSAAPVNISHIDFPTSVEPSEEKESNNTEFNNMYAKPNMPPPLLQGPSHSYTLPEDNYRFLERLSKEDLEELLNDEGKFTELYNRMPGLRKFFKERDQLYQTCQQLAKENLNCKPRLNEGTETLRAMQKEQLELSEAFHRNSVMQQTLNRHCNPQNLLDNMRVVAADAEHSSDRLAEDFVEGKLPLEDFMRQYTEERRKFHLRKVKEEKLTQMINGRLHIR